MFEFEVFNAISSRLISFEEIVGSCNEVIIEIMRDFYKQGQKEVRRADIVTTAFNIASAARKTVDNTLGNMVNSKEIRRPKKGVYSLNPKDIQKLTLVPDTLLGSPIGKSSNVSYINESDHLSSHDIETPL